jgi:uncharacterized protein YkwD
MKRLSFIILLFLLLIQKALAQSTLGISKRDFQNQFLDVINAKRAKGCKCGTLYMKPASPLVWNDQLASAAAKHAKDMYKNKYFSHDSRDGRGMDDRIQKAGYTSKDYQKYAIGENIAFGQQSIEEVLAGWFKSDGHCKNLMNPEFTEIGIAEYKTFWVQDFGGRVSFAFGR